MIFRKVMRQLVNHSMKRILVSAVPLVVMVTAAITATSPEAGVPINSAVQKYLAIGPANASGDTTIGQVVPAGRPWNFAPLMSKATYGSGVYFHVNQGFDPKYGDSSRALPYPPREVWCVVLTDASGSSRIVFTALHEDMYKADWILHESAAVRGTPLLGEWLASIGCDLNSGD
jgi:hypothetical protein